MKTCGCGGNLLRHGVSRQKNGDQYGIRYRCADCGKTFTAKVADVPARNVLKFGGYGRPTRNDWRMQA